MNFIKNISKFSWAKTCILLYLLLGLTGYLLDANSLSKNINLNNIYDSPFQSFSYLLGTDKLGRNVIMGLWNGASVSLVIGFFSSIIAFTVGSFLGFVSGYIGDNKVYFSLPAFLLLLAINLFIVFNIIYSDISTLLLLVIGGLVSMLIYRFQILTRYKIAIPFDTIILKCIEIFRSIPAMFLLIFLLSFFAERSIWNVVIIISILRWPSITRLIRGEILKIKSNNYIIGAESLGIGNFNLIKNHILPNIKEPLLVNLIYSFVGAILAEATLSFLGLGLPIGTISWGTMLSDSRSYLPAWWLAVFPGLAIFLVVTSLKKIGQITPDDDLPENY